MTGAASTSELNSTLSAALRRLEAGERLRTLTCLPVFATVPYPLRSHSPLRIQSWLYTVDYSSPRVEDECAP